MMGASTEILASQKGTAGATLWHAPILGQLPLRIVVMPRTELLTRNDMMEQLSYAYIHAIVSKAKFGCQPTPRHLDNIGLDIQVDVKEKLAADSQRNRFNFHIQATATAQQVSRTDSTISLSLKRNKYDYLRVTETHSPILLVALFLPEIDNDWLSQTEEGLISRNCAYWTCLHGAPQVNQANTTVHFKRENIFSVAALRAIATRLCRMEVIGYVQ